MWRFREKKSNKIRKHVDICKNVFTYVKHFFEISKHLFQQKKYDPVKVNTLYSKF